MGEWYHAATKYEYCGSCGNCHTRVPLGTLMFRLRSGLVRCVDCAKRDLDVTPPGPTPAPVLAWPSGDAGPR